MHVIRCAPAADGTDSSRTSSLQMASGDTAQQHVGAGEYVHLACRREKLSASLSRAASNSHKGWGGGGVVLNVLSLVFYGVTFVCRPCAAAPVEENLQPTPLREGNQEDGRALGQTRILQQSITDQLPEGVSVTIGSLPSARPEVALEVIAGVRYHAGLRIQAPETYEFDANALHAARMRLVIQSAQAVFGECARDGYYVPGGIGFTDQSMPLIVNSTNGLLTSTGAISFMFGGLYKLCYSYDGSFAGFGSSQLMEVPFSLQVTGSAWACSTDRCYDEYRWKCFVYQDEPSPQDSCELRIGPLEFVENLTDTALSWGPTVDVEPGQPIYWGCDGGAPSDRLSSGYRPPKPKTSGRQFTVQGLPRSQGQDVGGTGEIGFSVQACYCPNYDSSDAGPTVCDTDSDFVQPVGRIHFYTAFACGDGANARRRRINNCEAVSPWVAPGAAITLHIDCAGALACGDTSSNRMKVIDYHMQGVNDRPSWLEGTGCRTAVQSDGYWTPHNCDPNEVALCGGDNGNLHGGDLQNIKVFENVVFKPFYILFVPVTRKYDICYCDAQCESDANADAAANFHKVGQVVITPLKHLRHTEWGADTGISIATVPGDIMVDGSGNVPNGAQIKLLWDSLRRITTVDCAGTHGLVEFEAGSGPTCLNADDCSYKASTSPTRPPEWFTPQGRVVFFNDGGTQSERITLPSPGILAICYCGLLADGTGDQPVGECVREGDASYWLLFTKTSIRGPCAVDSFGACTEQRWSFYVGVVFSLTVRGIGLRSTDKLRIIGPNSLCDGSPDGGGLPTVFKGCPAACSPMNLADTYRFGGGEGKDDIDVQLATETTVGCNGQNEDCNTVRISEMVVKSDHTLWRFDGDPLLEDDDVVVLDYVNGSIKEENDLLAGRVGIEPLGWPVTRVESDKTKYTVPVHLGRVGLFSFTPGGGWVRQSSAITREEIKVVEPGDDLQVCWGSDHDTYHVRAGRIGFREPSPMPEASISLTAFEAERPAPVVVAFKTSSGGEAASRYKSAVGVMQIRLAFEDLRSVEPLFTDTDASPLETVARSDRDELRDAKLFVCGTLFLELWSSDIKGLPLPRGCYYHSVMDDSRRELHVVFDSKNGLEADTSYQIVFNARVSISASTFDHMLSVWSLGGAENEPYGVVELGKARLNRGTRRSAGIGEPRFQSAGGFRVLDSGGEFRDLLELTTDPTSLLFRLQGDGDSRITPGTNLRLFMWPLTVWDLQPSCQAQCYPHRTRVCGAVQSCLCQSVVFGGHRNIVKLQLPQEMTEIYGATVQHTIRVTELALPRLGFFGSRLGAQVSPPDDERAHYVESSGAFLWKKPSAQDPQMTLASVITYDGDGNHNPFRGDVANTLYVMMQLGASLFSELAFGDASMTVTLPPGYRCGVVEPAPSTLGIFGDTPPQGRGSLPASRFPNADGNPSATGWRLNSRVCEYRLTAGEMLPAQSRLILKLTVHQPDQPMPKVNVLNRWTIELQSRGRYRKSTQYVDPAPFVDSAAFAMSYGFADTNVAVIGKLLHDNLQPFSFKAGDRENYLQVFFQTQQRSGYFGQVRIIAPLGYNFATLVPDKCQPSRLDQSYYKTVQGVGSQYLPYVQSCISDCSIPDACPEGVFNRAKITVRNSFEPGTTYAFKINLYNAQTYTVGDGLAWSIQTTDSSEYALDASYPVARFNPAVGAAEVGWGSFLNSADPLPARLTFSTLLPTALTGGMSTVTISPLQVPQSFRANCRLTAPSGYVLSPLDFAYRYSQVPGVTASWPGGMPWQSYQLSGASNNAYEDQPLNVFLWDEAIYSNAETYGFTTKVQIPSNPITTTSRAFFLQFGWDKTELQDRPLTFTLLLPLIRSLTNFEVRYQTNVIGMTNYVTLIVETVSAIPVGGSLRFQTPPGFVFEEQCKPEVVQGESPWKVHLACTAAVNFGSRDGGYIGGTTITIVPDMKPLAAGRLAMMLKVQNPSEPRSNRGGQETECGYEECWSLASADADERVLDTQTSAKGFALNEEMAEAKLLDLNFEQRLATNRNDRPGGQNNLVFAFKLNRRPTSVGDLVLTGPYGFIFDEDCLPGLRLYESEVYEQSVFGYLDWFPGYDRWEQSARVRSCMSSGPSATMSVELGLRPGKLYVFRIHIARNPEVAPYPNAWTIEYAGESCAPFEGFTLWALSDFVLKPSTTAASTEVSNVPNPITFFFRPHKEVAAGVGGGVGGLLRILSPEGFVAVSSGLGSSCGGYSLKEVPAVGLGHVFDTSRDLSCQIDEDNFGMVSISLIGEHMLEAGRFYELVVEFYNPRGASETRGYWTIATFADTSASTEAALDSTTIQGFAVTAPAKLFTVRAPEGTQHAGAMIDDVLVEVASSATLQAGNTIILRAPAGFNLVAPRECVPYVGAVVGGTTTRLGFTLSILECAYLAWKREPDSNAAAWNREDRQCFAISGMEEVERCARAGQAMPANASSQGRRVQSEQCNQYAHEVCSYPPASRECNGFEFRGEVQSLSRPTCKGGNMTFRLKWEDKLSISQTLSFVLATQNPPSTGGLTENFWHLLLFDESGELAFSGSAKGWPVIPMLVVPSVKLTGDLRAAGSISQLTLDFQPNSDADTLQLFALAQDGFDFSGATLVASNVLGIGKRSVIANDVSSITMACDMIGGRPLGAPLVLEGVVLSNPGPAAFRLVTLRENLKADETQRVDGTDAFSVPGMVEVATKQLQSKYSLQPALYPYRSGFMPRTNDVAIATFTLMFGTPIASGDSLQVSAMSYSFPVDGFVKVAKLSADGSTSSDISITVPRESPNAGASAVLRATFGETLGVGGPGYFLRFETNTGPRTSNGEFWRLETWKGSSSGYASTPLETGGGQIPTNTNDGTTPGFMLVSPVSMQLAVGRVAAGSVAAVSVLVEPGDSQPTALVLYAPDTFTFPAGSCLSEVALPSDKIISCRRLDDESSVELQIAGEGLFVAAQTRININVPAEQKPEDANTWVIQAMRNEVETGWGEAQGFSIVGMEEGRVIYAGAPSVRQHMAVLFTTSQMLADGGNIVLRAPEVYKLSCIASNGFNTLNLPSVDGCDDSGNQLTLNLNRTMSPGSYVFIVGATNPAYTPDRNDFSVLLKDRTSNVVDARMNFQGERIIRGLDIRPPLLQFSSSEQLAEAEIHVTFRVSTSLDPYETGSLRALQIAVPERFSLVTRTPVKNLDGLPTPEKSWYHMYYADRLVRVDIVASDAAPPQVMPAGDYRLSFQVRLPEFWMPAINVWLLSLCRDMRCTDLIATMPMAGFTHGDKAELAPDGQGVQQGEQPGGAMPLEIHTFPAFMQALFWIWQLL